METLVALQFKYAVEALVQCSDPDCTYICHMVRPRILARHVDAKMSLNRSLLTQLLHLGVNDAVG